MPKHLDTITEELKGAEAFGPFQNPESIEQAVLDALFDMNTGDSIVVSKEDRGKWFIYIKE